MTATGQHAPSEHRPSVDHEAEHFRPSRLVQALRVVFRDPCCGAMVVLAPIIGVVLLVRWLASVGAFDTVWAWIVLAGVAGGITTAVLRARHRCSGCHSRR